MQKSAEEKLNPDHILFSEAKISRDLHTHLNLSCEGNEALSLDNHGGDGEEEEEEEFSFVCGGANASPIAAEDIFTDGQIRAAFPLFNRDLLFSGEDLAASPSVKKVFVETSEGEAGDAGWSNRKAVEASPSPSPEVCRKSNSTGFSRIWRFKDLLGRSNSDGRDAFVFLNSGQAAAATKGGETKKEKAKGKGKKKGETASLSAHEVYLKSKAAKEERRRSYLPYRPELMGFFTNVNGGLSKNVHPF